MSENYFVQGLLIGLVFGVPAGAIGALTIQRSLSHGFTAGFVTGLGSSAADVLYACISIFGITIVSDFLREHQSPISVIGGTLIMILGIFIFRKKGEPVTAQACTTTISRFFGTSFVLALANPATIMAFFLAFSSFGIGANLSPAPALRLILGILLGTCIWWVFLSGTVSVLRNRVTGRIYQRLNRLLGLLMFLFGLIMGIRTFI